MPPQDEIRTIGHYPILGELGRGGMGIVYKARDPSLNRVVAIKRLSDDYIHSPELVGRFIREAQSTAKLNHPNIVAIHSIGTDDTYGPYFVMEYVEGENLQSRLRREGKLDPRKAATLAAQVAAGLAAAHAGNVVHRDVKPANLLLDDNDRVKIADFGLAFLATETTRLTSTGAFMGTPHYLAPERCLGADPDPSGDIYSLGVTLYEALAGRVPFHCENALALLQRIVHEPAPPLSTFNPAVDATLAGIVARMMAKSPQQRYASGHDVEQDLRAYLAGEPVSAQPGVSPTVTADHTPITSSHEVSLSPTEIATPQVPALRSPQAVATPGLARTPEVLVVPAASSRSNWMPALFVVTVLALLFVGFSITPAGHRALLAARDALTEPGDKTTTAGVLGDAPTQVSRPKVRPAVATSPKRATTAPSSSPSTSVDDTPAPREHNQQAIAAGRDVAASQGGTSISIVSVGDSGEPPKKTYRKPSSENEESSADDSKVDDSPSRSGLPPINITTPTVANNDASSDDDSSDKDISVGPHSSAALNWALAADATGSAPPDGEREFMHTNSPSVPIPVEQPRRPTREERRQELLQSLQSDVGSSRQLAAKSLHHYFRRDLETALAVERELLASYRDAFPNKQHEDAVAWMCRILGASGDARFRRTLGTVVEGASSRKVRKHAKRSLDLLQ